MTITELLTRIFSTKKARDTDYIEANQVFTEYKSIPGKSKATQTKFVLDNNLDYIIIQKKSNKLVNIPLAEYNHRSHQLFIAINGIVGIDQLVIRLEAKHATKADNTPESKASPSKKEIEDAINQAYPIIELTEEEKFRDADGNIYDIEVRGTRSAEGILFKVQHVAEYFGIERLTEILQDENKNYIYKDDYLDLEHEVSQGSLNPTLGGIDKKLNNPSNRSIRKLYLTLNGMMRVVFVSNSGNDNKSHMREWIINLVYVHQFGSDIERMDLAEMLKPHKKCLTKHAGIYLINLGTVKALRDGMHISSEQYSVAEFDKAHVFKFGRSEDIIHRYDQHCSRTGYGSYSDKITMEWFIVIPPNLLSSAEAELSSWLKARQLKLSFNDGNKDHDELIIVKPGTERSLIKDKYFELVKNYPSDINAIVKQMTEMKTVYESKIEMETLRSEVKISKLESDLALTKANAERQLSEQALKAEIDKLKIISGANLNAKDLTHQVELLTLKLQIAELK